MIHIVASDADGAVLSRRRLPFYLAMEEWVAHNLPAADYFFTWRVQPTVIIGRNQDIAKEVDLDYCRDHGIQVYRRRSGGGCVYADMDNLMVSVVTQGGAVVPNFEGYAHRLAQMLRNLGLNAEPTGRNDVTVDGRKVSGNAYYRLPDRAIMHGTLLYNFDIESLSHAITPSRSKLESKSVQSVDSRITSISHHLHKPMSVEEFETYVISSLSGDDGAYTLTSEHIKAIEGIEQRYYDLHWTFGRRSVLSSPKDEYRTWHRVEGVGEISTTVTLHDGVIASVDMTGDFFILSDLDTCLYDHIIGCAPTTEALAAALIGVEVSDVISGLSNEQFIALLTDNSPIQRQNLT